MNSFWLFGSKLEIIGDQVCTGTDFDIVEGYFPPGAQSPVHVHSLYSETIYAVEGKLTICIPGEEATLKAGESYFIPCNVPHCIVNASQDSPFKALAITSTNGFAKLVRTVGIPTVEGVNYPDGEHDMAYAIKVMLEIGDTILGPPGSRP
jgi:mannose-6-phosphate isomerase-like protein (cupin superfamily)